MDQTPIFRILQHGAAQSFPPRRKRVLRLGPMRASGVVGPEKRPQTQFPRPHEESARFPARPNVEFAAQRLRYRGPTSNETHNLAVKSEQLAPWRVQSRTTNTHFVMKMSSGCCRASKPPFSTKPVVSFEHRQDRPMFRIDHGRINGSRCPPSMRTSAFGHERKREARKTQRDQWRQTSSERFIGRFLRHGRRMFVPIDRTFGLGSDVGTSIRGQRRE